MMSYEVEQRDDMTVVTPHGRLGEIEAHQLERELLTLVDQGNVRLVIDFADVPFVTSSCLGALMMTHKRVRAKSGFVRVAGAQPLVHQILEITKLTKLFGVYPAVNDALKA